jgi:hypothetical protein
MPQDSLIPAEGSKEPLASIRLTEHVIDFFLGELWVDQPEKQVPAASETVT